MPDRERELERELRELGARIEYPPTPDLARAARSRLDEEAVNRPRRFRATLPTLRWAAAAAFVLIVAVPALSPGLRATVGDWFEAGQPASSGQEAARESGQPDHRGGPATPMAESGGAAPSSGGPESGDSLGLSAPRSFGERITLREAQTRVGADGLLLPGTPMLGEPDEVYAGGPSRRDGVVVVYRAGPGLPPLGDTGIGLVLTEVPGEVEPAYLAGKSVAELGLDRVSVDGDPGYWSPAGRRLPSHVDRRDTLAGSLLFWERGGMALRLEADISKEEAVRIAGSVR
jgi:hypothetical protein